MSSAVVVERFGFGVESVVEWWNGGESSILY